MSVIGIDTRRLDSVMLPTVALLFLFSGFYKGIVPSPVDLTAFAAILLCVVLLIYLRDLDIWQQPAAWLFVALTAWLAIRLLPEPSSWGLRKIAETVLFGVPAMLAGYVIAKREDAFQVMLAVLSYAAIPAAIIMAVMAALTNPYSYQWIGSGGYQLTGMFMGLSLIATAVSSRYIAFGFAALGMAVAGSLTAALFAPPAIAFVWITRRKMIVKPIIAAMMLLTLYSALVAPPLVLMRVLWKIGAMENVVTLGDQAPRYGGAVWTNKLLHLMPTESQKYLVDTLATDRLGIYKSAIAKIRTAPIIGHGYGKVDYAWNLYPHDLLLEMLAEGGAIALLLLLSILVTSLPRIDDDIGAFAGGCLILFLGGSLVGGYWGNRILLFLLGFSMGRR
jgi:O-antigen ligase